MSLSVVVVGEGRWWWWGEVADCAFCSGSDLVSSQDIDTDSFSQQTGMILELSSYINNTSREGGGEV